MVDQYGNYYCDIDPNGDGLYPFSDVKCANNTNTFVNINGNIVGGCVPANESIVTCYAGFTATVHDGSWDCSQGADNPFFYAQNVLVPIYFSNRILIVNNKLSTTVSFIDRGIPGRINKLDVDPSFAESFPNKPINALHHDSAFKLKNDLIFENDNSLIQAFICVTNPSIDYYYIHKTLNFSKFPKGLTKANKGIYTSKFDNFNALPPEYTYIFGYHYGFKAPISGALPNGDIAGETIYTSLEFYLE